MHTLDIKPVFSLCVVVDNKDDADERRFVHVIETSSASLESTTAQCTLLYYVAPLDFVQMIEQWSSEK